MKIETQVLSQAAAGIILEEDPLPKAMKKLEGSEKREPSSSKKRIGSADC